MRVWVLEMSTHIRLLLIRSEDITRSVNPVRSLRSRTHSEAKSVAQEQCIDTAHEPRSEARNLAYNASDSTARQTARLGRSRMGIKKGAFAPIVYELHSSFFPRPV